MQRQLNPPVLTSQPARAKSFVSSPKDTLLNKPIASPPSLVHDFARIPIVDRGSFPVQPKLKINVPGDHYEQEADQMAEKAVTGADQSNGLVKAVSPKISHSDGYDAPPLVNHALHDKSNNGSPMSAGVTSKMNNAFGFDFSSVRIHADSKSAQLNDSIQARAFTHGKDLYFNRGEYHPDHAEGSRLLAHELTHVVQQTSSGLNQSGPPQTIQRSFGGFFANIGRAIANIFTDELDYSDDTIQKYLAVLDTGKIEDDYDSDNKARVVVRKWKKGKLTLTLARRIMLIREMFSGWTADDDENAILDILKGSPGELTLILEQIKPKELRDEFQGSEYKELDKLLKAWEKRTGSAKEEKGNVVPTAFKNKTELLGDGTVDHPGITLEEFSIYIKQQADWFTEDTLKADEFIRNKLWDAGILITEGDHTLNTLGKLKLDDVVKANADDLKLLREYAEGGKEGAQTVKIESHLTDTGKAIKLGEGMQRLKSFLPGVIIQIVFNEDTLNKLVDKGLIDELIKYYKEWEPTFERPEEGRPIITLLEEGVSTYDELKLWVRDLHIITKATRLKLLENFKDKSRSKPLLLILMSEVDHNNAFLQGPKLEEAILNTINLALLLQGQKSLKDFEIKAGQLADLYGVKPNAKSKGQIGQVIIAGHGNANVVELASSGKNPRKEEDPQKKGEYYVKYDQEDLITRSKGDPSEELIDSLLKRLDPKDAHFVFAGCLVGSHYTPSAGELKDTKKAAKIIRKSIADNPNLRDVVNERMRKLKVKGDVQAGSGTATFSDFGLDDTGRAKVGSDADPMLGGSKKQYVLDGREPEGALRAAVETWADETLGAAWTTEAMKKYVEKYKDDKDFWRATTRIAYEVALMNLLKDGTVDPSYLSDLSKRVSAWLDCDWETEISPKKLDEKLKPTEREHVLKSILDSELGKNSTYVQIVIYQVWSKTDPAKAPLFLDAIDRTYLIEKRLIKLCDPTFVDPLLPTLLLAADPANPTKAQLKLALAIAADRKEKMPELVKKLLKGAAGDKTTSSFPPALKVSDYLEGATELSILGDIGLAPGAVEETPVETKPIDPKAPAKKLPKDANADLDADKKTNESLVTVKPVRFVLRADSPVMDKASVKANIIDTLKKGTVVRVAGTFAGWAMIDHGGSIGFVDLTLVAELK